MSALCISDMSRKRLAMTFEREAKKLDIDFDRVTELYEKGWTIDGIAYEMDVSTEVLTNAITGLGLARRKTRDRWRAMWDLASEGKTYAEIAQILGLAEKTVEDRLRTMQRPKGKE